MIENNEKRTEGINGKEMSRTRIHTKNEDGDIVEKWKEREWVSRTRARNKRCNILVRRVVKAAGEVRMSPPFA